MSWRNNKYTFREEPPRFWDSELLGRATDYSTSSLLNQGVLDGVSWVFVEPADVSDLRAGRQPEFTQLDMEEMLKLNEDLIRKEQNWLFDRTRIHVSLEELEMLVIASGREAAAALDLNDSFKKVELIQSLQMMYAWKIWWLKSPARSVTFTIS
ncbi:hypothetical protein Droror1_Dr00019853, partial [Drosera rotundifolia]